MSTEGLTKDLKNKFSICSGIFQNCLVSIPVKKYTKYVSGTI